MLAMAMLGLAACGDGVAGPGDVGDAGVDGGGEREADAEVAPAAALEFCRADEREGVLTNEGCWLYYEDGAVVFSPDGCAYQCWNEWIRRCRHAGEGCPFACCLDYVWAGGFTIYSEVPCCMQSVCTIECKDLTP